MLVISIPTITREELCFHRELPPSTVAPQESLGSQMDLGLKPSFEINLLDDVGPVTDLPGAFFFPSLK